MKFGERGNKKEWVETPSAGTRCCQEINASRRKTFVFKRSQGKKSGIGPWKKGFKGAYQNSTPTTYEER